MSALREPLRRLRPARRAAPDDLADLVGRLPAVPYVPAAEDDQLLEESSLAHALRALARVDQDSEYRLCRELAEHALGEVPDPGTPSI